MGLENIISQTVIQSSNTEGDIFELGYFFIGMYFFIWFGFYLYNRIKEK